MEYAKKGALGGYKTVTEAEDCTHILLTVAEHQKLQQRLQKAKDDVATVNRDADQRVRRAQNDAAAQIQEAKDACSTELEELRTMLEQEQEEKEYQKKLNNALLRAARERANVDRNLRPKRERFGYLIMSSREIEQTYKEGRSTKKVNLWETVIQTPYAVDLAANIAKEQAFRDLFNKGSDDEDNPFPISVIGINGLSCMGYETMVNQDREEEYKAKREGRPPNKWSYYNAVATVKIRANVKAGFWELVFVHTKSLSSFPQEMRP